MGDSGSRRSTLVSRLPIFRRSTSKRQESLPSSPSSNNVNGIHTSSPSSTNSSSSSTGKRRSIFRTPSIGFHSKKASEQKLESADQSLSISNGTQPLSNNVQKLNSEVRTKSRHSFGFSGTRSKKITRSLTEDFERGKEPSVNRNVFINCISSGNHEGEDSGFIEEHSKYQAKSSSKKLLPKSFSSHHRLSKQAPQSLLSSTTDQSKSLPEPKHCTESEPLLLQTPVSYSVEIAGSSLQSPLLSTDHTTAQTPSECLPITEDSVSEVDVLPNGANTASCVEEFGHDVTTSQVFLNAAAGTATAATTVAIPGTESLLYEEGSCSNEPSTPNGSHRSESHYRAESNPLLETPTVSQTETSLERTRPDAELIGCEQTENSDLCSAILTEEKFCFPSLLLHSPFTKELPLIQQQTFQFSHKRSGCPVLKEIQYSKDQLTFREQQGYRRQHILATVVGSFSPCHEARFTERRLRSSSEGTSGSSRINLKLREWHPDEVSSLRKQRTSSSSSKMNSM
uniref:Coiled-coil serine rich protein 1 n=1 Tax=Latimeria chalumnae TaxID=7897 RepID=H3A7K9_LATCH